MKRIVMNKPIDIIYETEIVSGAMVTIHGRNYWLPNYTKVCGFKADIEYLETLDWWDLAEIRLLCRKAWDAYLEMKEEQ